MPEDEDALTAEDLEALDDVVDDDDLAPDPGGELDAEADEPVEEVPS